MVNPPPPAATADGAHPSTYPAAGLDRRFYAFVLDRLVAWSLYAGAAYLAYRLLDSVWAGVGLVTGVVVSVWLVHALLTGVAGVSPGKAVAGLRVVRHDAGTPVGVAMAMLRTLVLGLSAAPTMGLGVATLAWTALMDPSRARRGWHDRVAGSVVVDVRPAHDTPEDDEQEERPRQVVNLTAMRLMPAPEAAQPAAVTPASSAPEPPTLATPASPPTTAPPPAPPVAPPVPGERPGPGSAPAAAPSAGPEPRTVTPAPSAGRWRVSFDTGETLVVEGLVLVGRRPQPRRGEQPDHLLALPSEDMSLSKTHAQFQAAPDGALVVMDRGSTNGSMLIRQGVAKQLSAGRPATLIAGDRVRFGDREMSVARE